MERSLPGHSLISLLTVYTSLRYTSGARRGQNVNRQREEKQQRQNTRYMHAPLLPSRGGAPSLATPPGTHVLGRSPTPPLPSHPPTARSGPVCRGRAGVNSCAASLVRLDLAAGFAAHKAEHLRREARGGRGCGASSLRDAGSRGAERALLKVSMSSSSTSTSTSLCPHCCTAAWHPFCTICTIWFRSASDSLVQRSYSFFFCANVGQPGRSGMGLPGSIAAACVMSVYRRSKEEARMPATTPNMDWAELYVIAF